MLRRLASQSAVYALGTALTKASGLILAPFYLNTTVLPGDDFGTLGLLDAVKAFALLLAALGLPLALLRFASRSALTDHQRAALPVTVLAAATAAGGVVAVAGWLAAPSLAAWLMEDASRVRPVQFLALYVALKGIADVSYTELRRREKAGAYVAASLAETAILVGAVVYFLVARGAGLEGILLGYVISAGAAALGLTAVVLRHAEWRVEPRLIRTLLAFGAPLVISGVAARFLNLGDRLLLDVFVTREAMGVYEWASRLGGVVNMMAVQGFQLAFTVLGLKAAASGDAPGLQRSAFRHFAAGTGWVVLGLTLFAVDATRLFGGAPQYLQVEGLVLLIGGGFGIYGLYFVAVNPLLAAGRTREIALAVGGAAVLNAALNALLIPVLGIAGAAWATLVAYLALVGWTVRLSHSSLDVRYPWATLAWAAMLVVGLWVLARPTADWNLPARLAARCGIALAYLPLLRLTGIYSASDLVRGRALLRDVLRRDPLPTISGDGSTDRFPPVPPGADGT